MEEQKIFLKENESVMTNNVESSINVGLFTKNRLLPGENLSDTLSLFEQYNKERDNCSKFRLIATINPVCSNVLYNMKSEIMIDEGSDSCRVIADSNSSDNTITKEWLDEHYGNTKIVNTVNDINYKQAIKDTEYSHPQNGKFIYHCGVDIFDNHMLRSKGFIHINKTNDEDKTAYNTINDTLRDETGKQISEDIYVKVDSEQSDRKVPLHIYTSENLLSFQDAFAERCKEKDGWWGFTNPGNIDIPNSVNNNVNINRMMANNKACEFIDLYPDRSLFSFNPKFNKAKKRIEKNWDYCITYPYAKDCDVINDICGGQNQAVRATIKKVISPSASELLQCSSYFKHNLKVGDFVYFYYYEPRTVAPYSVQDEKIVGTKKVTFQRFQTKVKVMSLGDANGEQKDRIFSVKYDSISAIYKMFVDDGCFYKKISHGAECQYYLRKFKKIKALGEDGEKREPRSDINKIAFAQNIYGDDVSQILFTDDIDIEGLLDYNGRPITEIFLTVIKRNSGHKDWYEKGVTSGSTIEFSHCFGKVTSGVDLGGIEDEPKDYNVHCLHNIDWAKSKDLAAPKEEKAIENTEFIWGEAVENMPKVLEDDITIDDDIFCGDIVEFDPYNYLETVVCNVCHRFNTAQRESLNPEFRNIYQTVLVSDDYDSANGTKNAFSTELRYINHLENGTSPVENIETMETIKHLFYGNIAPEGYYYKPHIRIQVRETDGDSHFAEAKYINYGKAKVSVRPNFTNIEIEVPVNYGFYYGDYIAMYDKIDGITQWGEIVGVSGNTISLKFDGRPLGNSLSQVKENVMPYSASRRFFAFWTEYNVPTFAKYVQATNKFYWKNITPPSEIIRDSEIYDMPFANGRFYVQKNANFFLRRQDPTGKYGLSIPINNMSYSSQMANFMVTGYDPIDLSEVVDMLDKLLNTCY